MGVHKLLLGVSAALFIVAGFEALAIIQMPQADSFDYNDWAIWSTCKLSEAPKLKIEANSGALNHQSLRVDAKLEFDGYEDSHNCRLKIQVPSLADNPVILEHSGAPDEDRRVIKWGESEKLSGESEPLQLIEPFGFTTPSSGEGPWTVVKFSVQLPTTRIGLGIYRLATSFNDPKLYSDDAPGGGHWVSVKQLVLQFEGRFGDRILQSDPLPKRDSKFRSYYEFNLGLKNHNYLHLTILNLGWDSPTIMRIAIGFLCLVLGGNALLLVLFSLKFK